MSIQKGCRIQAITFKLKNMEGMVRYVGQVPGKDGQWVGIELNEEKGDMDGTVNGEMLFGCKPGHGVLLRPTQVKVLEQPPASMQEESPIKVSDSPLVDSLPEVTNQVQPQLQQQPPKTSFAQRQGGAGALTSFLNQKAPVAAPVENSEQAESSVAKALNWKNKVEELRRKKQMQEQEKAIAAAAATASETQSTPDPVKEEQKEEIKQMFAPAPGLPTKAAINPSDVLKANPKFKPLTKLQQEASVVKIADNPPEPVQQPEAQQEEKKKLVPPATATKIGASTIQKPVVPANNTVNPPSKLPVKAQPVNNAAKAVDEKKEQLLKLKQDKEKRDTIKGTEASKVTPQTGTTTAPATAGPTKIVPAKPALKKDEETKQPVAPTGTSKIVPPALGASAQASALKKQLGASTTDASKPAEAKASTLRPTTARGTKADPLEPATTTTAPLVPRRVTAATSKLGAPPQPSKLPTKSLVTKSNQPDNIPEVDHDGGDDDHLLDSKSPSQQPSKFSMEPTEAQLLHFMQTTGQGVSQDEHKKVTEELRKKKEEVYALQHEVKDLADKIQNVQNEANTQQELLKTEMEIKVMELEQKLVAAQQAAQENLSQEQIEAAAAHAAQAAAAAESAAQKVAAGYQQQISAFQAQIEQHTAERQKMMEETQEMQKALQFQQDQQREKFQADIAFLKSRISDSENRFSDLNKLYAEAEAEKSKLQEEVEAKQADVEIVQLELEALKDEKEELLNQMQLMSQMSQEDALAGLSEDELKSQNNKLRQAISTLTLNYEVEKQRFAGALAEAQRRAGLVDEYEKKLEQMDFLIEEVENKEQERVEMEARLDDCLEYEKCFEEMAEEIIRHEEENEELKNALQELENDLDLQNQISEQLEDQIRDMNEQLANKEAQISEMEVEKQKLGDMVLDENQINQKYKDRLADFQQQYKVLQEQLQQAYAVGDQKFKISALLEKQNLLLQKVREAGRRESDLVIGKLVFWQEKLRQKVVEAIIPQRLVEQAQLEALERIQLLGITKGQALVLIRELCERQFSNLSNLHEEPADQLQIAQFFLKLANLSCTYIDLASKITYWLSKIPVTHYVECMQKLHSWSKLAIVNSFLEQVIGLIKEEARMITFDLSVFESSVKAIQELEAQVALKYSDKRENEETMDQSRKREQEVKLVENNKLRLRNQIIKMCIAVTVISCPQLSQKLIQHSEETQQKCKVVYWKLINILFQLDMIDANSTGLDYLNLQDLGTDTRLDNKYQVIAGAMWVSPETAHQDKRDWMSVLEAVERDIASLINDYKYRKLIQAIDASYMDKKPQSVDDMYTKGWDIKGPWNQIIATICKDFEEVEMIKDKIVKMQEKTQQMTKEQSQLKKERDEYIVIKQTLESRLSENIVKAEQVPTLQLDIKRMQEKEQVILEQMGQAKIDIEAMREREKDLYKRIEDMQIQTQIAVQQATAAALAQGSKRGARAHIPPPVPVPVAQTPSSGATTVAQTPSGAGHQQKSSKTTEFFKQMQSMASNKGSFAGRGSLVTPSNQAQSLVKVDSIEVQRQLQNSEDSFNTVIIELQKDRMAMKGQQLMERLKQIDCKSENMSQFIKKQKEKQDNLKRYTKYEQNVLENVVGTIEGLKSRVKKEMASVKVVDLQKVDISTILPLVANTKQQEQQKGGSKEEPLDSIKLKEKINYMIVKAKDQANDAFNLLFSKESQMNKIKDLSDAVTVEIVQEDLTAIEEFSAKNTLPTFNRHQEKINIAQIRLQGLPKLKKVVNLTDQNLKDFKQNISVFAH